MAIDVVICPAAYCHMVHATAPVALDPTRLIPLRSSIRILGPASIYCVACFSAVPTHRLRLRISVALTLRMLCLIVCTILLSLLTPLLLP